MKLIKPSVELWEHGWELKDIWNHVAKCTRVCYQSNPKSDNEDGEAFVRRVIFRNSPDSCPFNHLSVLEHGTVYMIMPTELGRKYKNNPYSKVYFAEADWDNEDEVGKAYVTTNLRVLVENEWLDFDKQFITPRHLLHSGRQTFSIITDIGVSRELNRHRCHSISEESTRYCNYSKGKFGNEITFIEPEWYDELSPIEQNKFNEALESAEKFYLTFINYGWVPQRARQVLDLNTKTQVVHTAFTLDWMDFLDLRLNEYSGKVHPNTKIIASKISNFMYGVSLYKK